MAKYVDKAVIVDMLRTKAELGRASGYGACYDNAAKMVELLPAADVAPVRHGRWEAWMPDKNGETREFICTGCRFMVEMSWKQKECDYEWCPYCGAKMDKEV